MGVLVVVIRVRVRLVVDKATLLGVQSAVWCGSINALDFARETPESECAFIGLASKSRGRVSGSWRRLMAVGVQTHGCWMDADTSVVR